VVKTPEQNNGEKETLFLIAQDVLGDGNRFQEIFNLNNGRVEPDGTTFTNPDTVLPGYILVLPDDASGPDVQLGQLTSGSMDDPSATATAAPTASTATQTGSAATSTATSGTVSLFGTSVSPWLIGLGVGALAALTVLLTLRKKVGRGVYRLGKGVGRVLYALRPRLPRFAALALRRRRRAALGNRLAADSLTPLVVRHAVHELVTTPGPSGPVRVYSALATSSRISVAVSGGATPPAAWTATAPNRWERAGQPRIDDVSSAWEVSCPQLVRVGVDEAGTAQVMVDLAQINGALSVTGDSATAQDTIAALVRGLLDAPRQDTVVLVVDPTAQALPGFQGVLRIPTARELVGKAPAEVLRGAEGLGLGLVRGAARSGPVKGFVVMPRVSSDGDAAVLAELSSLRGGDWIVLAVGDVKGAHWRWYAEPDGTVDTGVLGLRVTVPTQASLVSGSPVQPVPGGEQFARLDTREPLHNA
jgi:hypothetical protein